MGTSLWNSERDVPSSGERPSAVRVLLRAVWHRCTFPPWAGEKNEASSAISASPRSTCTFGERVQISASNSIDMSTIQCLLSSPINNPLAVAVGSATGPKSVILCAAYRPCSARPVPWVTVTAKLSWMGSKIQRAPAHMLQTTLQLCSNLAGPAQLESRSLEFPLAREKVTSVALTGGHWLETAKE